MMSISYCGWLIIALSAVKHIFNLRQCELTAIDPLTVFICMPKKA